MRRETASNTHGPAVVAQSPTTTRAHWPPTRLHIVLSKVTLPRVVCLFEQLHRLGLAHSDQAGLWNQGEDR